jgi:hypothetical protein
MTQFSAILDGIAFKKLVPVDLPEKNSNQHELNGSTALRKLFNNMDVSGEITWHYISEAGSQEETGNYRFYDARKKSAAKTGRSEWRMYYSGGFLGTASSGDCLLIIKTKKGEVHGVIISAGSQLANAVVKVFSINEFHSAYELVDEKTFKAEINFLNARILAECGVEIPENPYDYKIVTSAFGLKFPSTAEMSKLARDNASFDLSDLDGTLMAWLLREEQFFYALEKQIIDSKLAGGFKSSDDFIQFSLSVQNRRKSRMGHSFENHIEEIFKINKIRYEKNVRTERGNKPDFIFPSAKKYSMATVGATDIKMLAAKSTVKERWRQILEEADRIPVKNLCTIDPGISEKQLAQMIEKKVELVVPVQIQAAYSDSWKKQMRSFGEFVDIVKKL